MDTTHVRLMGHLIRKSRSQRAKMQRGSVKAAPTPWQLPEISRKGTRTLGGKALAYETCEPGWPERPATCCHVCGSRCSTQRHIQDHHRSNQRQRSRGIERKPTIGNCRTARVSSSCAHQLWLHFKLQAYQHEPPPQVNV